MMQERGSREETTVRVCRPKRKMLSNSQSSKSRPRRRNAARMLHRSKLPAATQWWFRASLKGGRERKLCPVGDLELELPPRKLGLSRLMCSIRSSLSPSSKTAGGLREGREETSHGLSRSQAAGVSPHLASPLHVCCASYGEESKPALRGSSLVLLVYRADRVQTAKSVEFRGARSRKRPETCLDSRLGSAHPRPPVSFISGFNGNAILRLALAC